MNDRVISLVRDYLVAYPAEAEALTPLLDLASASSPVTARTTLPGHVTCGAVVVDTTFRVLQIHHRVLDRWLFPGGHVEREDATLAGAALRELAEETGVHPSTARPLRELPMDIDVHVIPENPARAEPEHTHYDFRFVFQIQRSHSPGTVDLRLDEVTDHRWLPVADLPGPAGARITSILAG
ncbi:NUDIX hydrolase [Frankia sp. AgB32]|uniref:NUDIX hydrolase n=1 Tax=Frankia sp. AgB32 TaxID=631119 RepID=UPI00200EE837|nr:NUDIX domain-containing protein [Frankia sp. AgB32]MCK9896718.1 NUDIX domain-containing protein [Frankia sp. AgB32]